MTQGAGADDLLLEREVETSLLAEAIGSAAAGRGSLVVVEGPAGVGKSRLLAWAADRARQDGLQVVSARASRQEQNIPFAVAVQLFDIGAAVAARSEAGTHDCLDRLFRLVVERARPSGLAAVIDDAQSADHSSLSFLVHLVARIDDLAVTVVVARRQGEVDAADDLLDELTSRPGVRLLRLPPLHEAGPAALTPSELRVAEMAASGLSNPRIAETLFVGTKAVEFHLGNVYRKLGIHSRSALPEVLGTGDDAGKTAPGS